MASVQDTTKVPATGDSHRPAPELAAPAQAPSTASNLPARQSSDISPVAVAAQVSRSVPGGFIAGLPYNQELALQAILEGKSAGEVAEIAGVRRETIYRWRTRDPKFIAAMNLWRRQVKQAVTDSMALMTERALAIVSAALDKQDLRAAITVLNHMKRESFGSGDPDAIVRRLNNRARKLSLADRELTEKERKIGFM